MKTLTKVFSGCAALIAGVQLVSADGAATPITDNSAGQAALENLLGGRFHWRMSQPLVFPAESESQSFYSVKDPSIVFFEGRWHLFCTVRGKERSHQIEYLSFEDWADTRVSARTELMRDGNGIV